ncbi:MAG: hypothetical protein IIW45_00175 [Alistipes sp.]|nr:hypothetical protein [Alistipes sp.]
MKKSLVILIIALFAGAYSAEAQKTKYSYHRPGYWGNIELNGGALFSEGSNIGFSTVHGGRLGHGLAMGIGVGLYVDVMELYYVYNVPIFLETKYSPMKSGLSPFVSLRTGFSVTDYLATGFYLSPAVGVDLRRFSLFIRYGYNLFPMSADISFPDLDMNINTKAYLHAHSLSLGVAINF